MRPESNLSLAYLLSAAGIVVCVVAITRFENWPRCSISVIGIYQ